MSKFNPVLLALGVTLLFVGGTYIVYSNSRGLKNNNAGNIRHSTNKWVGQSAVQNDPAFVQFDAPEYGIRALYRNLLAYRNRGLHTVNSIINTWAPPSENNTSAYVKAVASSMNLDVGDIVPLSQYPELIKAIIKHENGINPYPDLLIMKGMSLA